MLNKWQSKIVCVYEGKSGWVMRDKKLTKMLITSITSSIILKSLRNEFRDGHVWVHSKKYYIVLILKRRRLIAFRWRCFFFRFFFLFQRSLDQNWMLTSCNGTLRRVKLNKTQVLFSFFRNSAKGKCNKCNLHWRKLLMKCFYLFACRYNFEPVSLLFSK